MMKKTLSLFLTFFKIGAFTFGGGYAMIALLENEFVEKKRGHRGHCAVCWSGSVPKLVL